MNDSKLARIAKLIYCETEEFQAIKDCFETNCNSDYQVHSNVHSLVQLRDIQPGHLYLVSEQHLMRGFDYRCSSGMAVLIAKKLDSKRALR